MGGLSTDHPPATRFTAPGARHYRHACLCREIRGLRVRVAEGQVLRPQCIGKQLLWCLLARESLFGATASYTGGCRSGLTRKPTVPGMRALSQRSWQVDRFISSLFANEGPHSDRAAHLLQQARLGPFLSIMHHIDSDSSIRPSKQQLFALRPTRASIQ